MNVKVGNTVKTRHGSIGVASRMYDDFSACAMSCLTMTGDEWLNAQSIPFTDDHLSEPWFRVSIATGGSEWSPASELEVQTA